MYVCPRMYVCMYVCMYDVKDIVNSYIPYMLAFALREVYIFDTMY